MIKKNQGTENGGQSSNLYTICINEHDEKQPSNVEPENNVELTKKLSNLK